jgi:AraC family transcriptional regulator of arabinose operon
MAYRNPTLFATVKSSNPHISLCHIGRDTCESNYCYGPAMRNAYLVHFVTSGKGTYIARNNTFHVSANQAFIIYPNEITTYIADEVEPWEYCFFSFNGEMVEELIERTGFADGNMVISMDDGGLADLIIETANRILSEPQPNTDIYAISQLFCIIKILMDHAESRTEFEAPTKDYVQHAINYIQFNYASPMTIAGLAEMLSINRSYFYRIFKAEIGISPIEYLNNYRIDQAKKMLLESTMPISQIAMATGFNTFSSFYRLFSLKYGHSPREYRSLYNKSKEIQPGFA